MGGAEGGATEKLWAGRKAKSVNRGQYLQSCGRGRGRSHRKVGGASDLKLRAETRTQSVNKAASTELWAELRAEPRSVVVGERCRSRLCWR